MPTPDNKSYIEDLKKSLYSRTTPEVQTRRKIRFDDINTDVKTDWSHPEQKPIEPIVLNKDHNTNSMSFFTKLFIFSIIFCIIVVSIGAYLFFNGTNFISGDNIDITISGPVSIPGGSPVKFDIIATNNNNIELELVDMVVDFPLGTTEVNNSSKILKSYRKLLGNIKEGESVSESVEAIIFGEENIQKQIQVTLTYNLKGSTSIFNKTKSYDVIINSSPLRSTVSMFKEITSGQEFDIKVEIDSNSKESVKGVIFEVIYPFGFKYLSSTLEPVGNKSTWIIGDIPAGGKRAFTIRGSLTGEDEDFRVFHFNIGSKDPVNTNKIGIQYMSIQRDVIIQKPFVTLGIEIEGDEKTDDYIGKFDKDTRVTINWFNNLPTVVSNMKISVDITGSAYDKSTIVPDSGYFNSITNSIVWNEQTNPELASVGPSDSGNVSFVIVPRDLGNNNNPVTNPFISLKVNVSGNRTQETNVPSAISSLTKRNILVASNLDLTGRIVRSLTAIQNSGPIPPKADQTSTYTVIWSISNTSNEVRDAEVRATLPAYVKWLNVISPNSEEIIYDENSGLITWNVGKVDSYTSRLGQRKEVAFQVAFTPSVIQIGSSPILINESNLTATDVWTKTKLNSRQDALTTRFSTDPIYKQGDEAVVE